MIQLNKEKSLRLTSQNVYDIISKAIDLANDEGFINQFVFERALYLAAIAVVDETMRDSIADGLQEKTPMEVWDEVIQTDTIKNFAEEYKAELEYVNEQAASWFEDYRQFAASPRGMIESLELLTSNMTSNLTGQFDALQNNEKINETLKIAKDWGMDNANVIDAASLFDAE